MKSNLAPLIARESFYDYQIGAMQPAL